MLLDQYKAYLADLGNLGTRYTTMNGFYTSIVSALLGILALAKRGESLANSEFLLYIVIPIFACFLCFVWRNSMKTYSAHFRRRFSILRMMETELPFNPFTQEEQQREKEGRIIRNDE